MTFHIFCSLIIQKIKCVKIEFGKSYLYIRQYIVIITNPGIQKLTELDMIAYVLFALNRHSLGLRVCNSKYSAVVYQPKNIGVKDINAGSIHTLANIKNTVRFVIYNGYSSGRTIA